MRGEDLTVAEAADVLGTSPQTVRTLLRKGELRGERHPWGSRFVWKVSHEGLEEFLSEYGRLEGRRRARVRSPAPPGPVVPPLPAPEPETTAGREVSVAARAGSEEATRGTDGAARPFVLRPRGRATVVVLVLGLPILLAYAAARTLPDALWFHELGQSDVFRTIVMAKVEFRSLVAGLVGGFLWANLAIGCRTTWVVRRRSGVLALVAVSLAVGGLFASAAAGHWQTYLLWRHRQAFGVVDPVHGKDIGFFVFTLPLELLVAGLLLWLLAVTAGCVALVHVARGTLRLRPRHADFEAQLHLAVLGGLFLLVVAWRLHLQEYLLELRQPGAEGGQPFAGAAYVDVHVRTPVLAGLAAIAVILAMVCVATPLLARRGGIRRIRPVLGIAGVVVAIAALIAVALLPALIQRYVVDPNPLASETPYLERSMAATRQALGLDRVEVEPYTPARGVTAADFPSVDRRLDQVSTWDAWLLADRMRQLVTDTPYFSPEAPTLDVVRVDGRRQPTVVSARELDVGPTEQGDHDWSSGRLAYTHGLGLIRFSGTDVGPDREPRLLDTGLGVREPRIYFGNLSGPEPTGDQETPGILAPTVVQGLADSSWVLVDTRRPEVDIASALGSPRPAYHYRGPAGISLSSWPRRAVFALALGSKQVLLSDDLTSRSRILLHRDVHDRLATLAPFLHWDHNAVPLTYRGRIVFVVDGYTTSTAYPYAQHVDLGGTRASYVRPSVRATVDAYSGTVSLYLTDPADPLARAWAEAFPSLFRPADEMPAELAARARYPAELFDAQAATYERFHTESADVFASGSDVWSRPIALSGPLEVAGGVDFDESDEDDLRLTFAPSYAFGAPPGHTTPRLVLSTYYTPRRGQNLVAALTGWVDDRGRPHLVSRSLPRDPVVLGPAQISRLVFATPRVRNLLGLRNLEIRDLDKSSLDSVFLGRPHLLFLEGGIVQVQSLYEGSRGPGAARLLGVTVFVNGHAGLGPDVASAARQALNEPPQVEIRRPRAPATVGSPVRVAFRVENARREIVTIGSGAHRRRERFTLTRGQGVVSWVPAAAGGAQVRVDVLGLDGTRITATKAFPVFSRPPAIRILHAPRRAAVGRTVRIAFKVSRGRHALAQVSTRAGIVFSRRYLLRDHAGVLEWTPDSPGLAVVRLRARGRQGQMVSTSLRVRVHQHASSTPPVIALVDVPSDVTVGVPATFVLRADACHAAVARIRGPVDDVPVWRFPCPVARGTFSWTPGAPGTYVLTASAHGSHGLDASQRLRVEVAPGPSPRPSSTSSRGRVPPREPDGVRR